jgi:hexosaminidase
MPGNLTADQSKLLYGVQGNLFAEYIPTEQHMEYMMYPRMLAISEIAWSVPHNKDFNNFKARALKAIDHLQQIGYNTFNLRNEVGNRPGADTELKHLAVGKPVQYIDGSSYYSGYTAGGDSALVDGLRGGWTYGDKRWQGFLGSNGVDVVIDLEKLTPIKSINADFMQICGPGVYMPSNITISASIDGKTYSQLINIANEVISDDAVTFKTFGWEGNTQARYIRYEAQRSHFGGFLFLDEIVIQ